MGNRNTIAFGFERKCTVIKNFFPKRVKSRKHNTHTVLNSWFHTDTRASHPLPPAVPVVSFGHGWRVKLGHLPAEAEVLSIVEEKQQRRHPSVRLLKQKRSKV